MKKLKLKKNAIIFIVIIILAFVLFPVGTKVHNSKPKNKIIGTWVSEGGTIYVFEKKGKGVLRVPLGDYNFKYKIKDDVLSIDFEYEKAVDTDYKYSFKKDGSLVVKSDRGTFTFTRK